MEKRLIDLSDDILIDDIFPYLDLRDLLALSASCNRFRHLVANSSVWHDLYSRYFGTQPTPFDRPQPLSTPQSTPVSPPPGHYHAPRVKWPEIFKFRTTAHLYTWGASSLGRLGLDLSSINGIYKSVPSGSSSVNVGRLGAFEPGIVRPQRVTKVDHLTIADIAAGGFSFTFLTTNGEIVGIGDLQKFLPRPGGPGGRGGIVGRGGGGIFGGRGIGTGGGGAPAPLMIMGGPSHRTIPQLHDTRPVDTSLEEGRGNNSTGSSGSVPPSMQRIPLMGAPLGGFVPFNVGGIIRNAQTHNTTGTNNETDANLMETPQTNPIASQSSPSSSATSPRSSLISPPSGASKLIKAESLSLPLTLADRASPKTLSTDTIISPVATTEGIYQVDPTMATPRFISISSGREHLIALDDRNNIWMWDRTYTERGKLLRFDFNYYELTSNSSSINTTSRSERMQNRRVIKIMAGWNYSAALIEDIGLVVWFDVGEILNPQVGSPEGQRPGNSGYRCDYAVVTIPIPPPSQQQQSSSQRVETTKVVDFMTGHCFLILLDQYGRLHKLVGVSSLESVMSRQPRRLIKFETRLQELQDSTATTTTTTTTTIKHRNFVRLSGSYRTFAVLSDCDDVFLGHDDGNSQNFNHIQNNNGSGGGGVELMDDSEPLILPELQQADVISISVGDYHCLALLRGGKLLSWGVESKNCGCLGMGKAEDVLARFRGESVEEQEQQEPLCESIHAGLKLRRPRIVNFEPEVVAGENRPGYVLAIAAAGWQSCAIVTHEQL